MLERDALVAVVAQQKRVIQLLSTALVVTKETLMPTLEDMQKVCGAIDIAGQAIKDAGLNDL